MYPLGVGGGQTRVGSVDGGSVTFGRLGGPGVGFGRAGIRPPPVQGPMSVFLPVLGMYPSGVGLRWENRPSNRPLNRETGLVTGCGSKLLKVILIDSDLDITLS